MSDSDHHMAKSTILFAKIEWVYKIIKDKVKIKYYIPYILHNYCPAR